MNGKMIISTSLVILFLTGILTAGNAVIQVSQDNEILLSAASQFEDLIEYALAGNSQGMNRVIQIWDDQAAGVNEVIPIEVWRDLTTQIDSIRIALKLRDNEAVAMNAVEAYRLLVQSLAPEAMVAPVAVSMLDYAGFRTNVLLHAPSPDWAAIQETAEEAQRQWLAIEGRLDEHGLRDVMHTMIAGMIKAATTQNPDMAGFAADMDLALVDVLEGYFERAIK